MSNNGSNQLGPKGQMVMGGIFVVAAIVVFLLGLGDLRAARAERAAAAWPTVSGTVIRADVKQLHGSNVPNARDWVPDIRYSYEVDGRKYTGDTYQYYTSSSTGTMRPAARTRAEKHKVGGAIRLHVDPENPNNSIVFPRKMGVFVPYVFLGGAGVGALVGLGILGFGLRGTLAGD